MHKKNEETTSGKLIPISIPAKHASNPEGTMAVVKRFRSRAELAIEKAKNQALEWEEDYRYKIFESYTLGGYNLDDESRLYFNNALCIFGETLSILNQDQEYSKMLFMTDINNLNLTEQFRRTILCFLLDMDDLLNIKQMKIFIRRSREMKGGDEEELGDLLEYLDEIISATKELIRNRYIEVKLDFYYKNNQI